MCAVPMLGYMCGVGLSISNLCYLRRPYFWFCGTDSLRGLEALSSYWRLWRVWPLVIADIAGITNIAGVTDSADSAEVRRRCRYRSRALYQWPVFSEHPCRLFPNALISVPQYSSMPVIPDGRMQGPQVSQYACDPRWQDSRYPNSGLIAVVSDPESFDTLQFLNGVEF